MSDAARKRAEAMAKARLESSGGCVLWSDLDADDKHDASYEEGMLAEVFDAYFAHTRFHYWHEGPGHRMCFKPEPIDD